MQPLSVHLIDGTYELFRQFYGRKRFEKGKPAPFGAVAGVLHSILEMVEKGATHVGVATDHVIESFRNELWPGYKTGEGIEPALRNQFELLEDVLRGAGVAVFAMVEHEADDALATAAAIAAGDPRVTRVEICTPDKDLAQCVEDPRVVQLDRRRGIRFDEAGVVARFGVPPASIPDYLALVGDSADGFPGIPGWGAKSAAAVLARYRRLEDVPAAAAAGEVKLRGADKLAATLAERREEAQLYRTLATLVAQGPEVGKVDDWRWRGPTAAFAEVAASLGATPLHARLERLASARRS